MASGCRDGGRGAVLAIAACDGDDDDEGGNTAAECKLSEGKVTPNFWTRDPGVEKAVALWNEQNPNIQVRVKETPAGNAGTYQNMFNALEAATPPTSERSVRLAAELPAPGRRAGHRSVRRRGRAQGEFIDWTWQQVSFGADAAYAVPQAVLLPSIVRPFGVYLSRIYAAASVPDDLIEAGRLDGAGEFRIFFTVAVRLMVPALVTIYLFQFVTIWNNFFLPLIMLVDNDLYPITLGLFAWQSQTARDPELVTAVIVGAFLSIAPLVAAFLMLQRYWRGGLGAGAVKG